MKKLINLFSVMCIILVLFSCENELDNVIPLESISIPEETRVYVNDTVTLDVTFVPSNATNLNYTIEFSDAKVAKVTKDNRIVGVKQGSSNITVISEDGGYKAEGKLIVEVPSVPVTGIKVKPKSMDLTEGDEEKFEVIFEPVDATIQEYEVEIDDEDVVRVKGSKVIAKSEGEAVITFTSVDGGFTAELEVYVEKGNDDGNGDGDNGDPSATNLSAKGTANSYIVSKAGAYKFKPTRGNSAESVGAIASVELLWETFGTDVQPNVGDLISTVSYANGYITFNTNAVYKEGNALIAAKDASGTILWSWHIWFTDQPRDQIYNNNAGTMMDRNLGATSATKGDVGALGLLYQWGRKDPFLSGESIISSTPARSTLVSWSLPVSSDASIGTIAYTTSHPTTVIICNNTNGDWYYSGNSNTDNTRWQSEKTIYDPCPVGYRVPDGGDNGIWSTAFGILYFEAPYDNINKGFDFGYSSTQKYLINNEETCWYPASGMLGLNGLLSNVGVYGSSWSCTPSDLNTMCHLYISENDEIYSVIRSSPATAYSVRCLKEASTSGGDNTPTQLAKPALDLVIIGDDLTVTWKDVGNADYYAYTINDGDIATTKELSVIFNNLENGEYTVKVKACPVSDSQKFTESEFATIEATINALPDTWFTQTISTKEEYSYYRVDFTYNIEVLVSSVSYRHFLASESTEFSDAEIIQYLMPLSKDFVAALNESMSIDYSVDSFEPETEYEFVAYATAESGQTKLCRYRYTTTAMTARPAALEQFLGRWTITSEQTLEWVKSENDMYIPTFTNEPKTGSVTFEYDPYRHDQLFIYGLSEVGSENGSLPPALARYNEHDQTLEIITGSIMGQTNSGDFIIWGCALAGKTTGELYDFISLEIPAYTLAFDGDQIVTKERYEFTKAEAGLDYDLIANAVDLFIFDSYTGDLNGIMALKAFAGNITFKDKTTATPTQFNTSANRDKEVPSFIPVKSILRK